MALSNMRREPRREITETVVGLVVVGGLLWGDYAVSAALCRAKGTGETGDMLVGMVVVPVMVFLGLVVLTLAAHAAHRIGEIVCTELDQHGIHLRPLVRPPPGRK